MTLSESQYQQGEEWLLTFTQTVMQEIELHDTRAKGDALRKDAVQMKQKIKENERLRDVASSTIAELEADKVRNTSHLGMEKWGECILTVTQRGKAAMSEQLVGVQEEMGTMERLAQENLKAQRAAAASDVARCVCVRRW